MRQMMTTDVLKLGRQHVQDFAVDQAANRGLGTLGGFLSDASRILLRITSRTVGLQNSMMTQRGYINDTKELFYFYAFENRTFLRHHNLD
jgi:hypothetical protein